MLRLFFIFSFLFISLEAKEEWILYSILEGDLQEELDNFWLTCKNNPNLKNKAVIEYPPHITLTKFYPKKLEKGDYISALKQALEEYPLTVDFNLKKSQIERQKKFHGIYFKSNALSKISERFCELAGIPKKYLASTVKNPEYHLSLSRDFKPKFKDELIALEQAIDFNKPFGVTLGLFKYNPKGPQKVELIYLE